MKIKYFLAVSFLLPIISYAQNIFEGVILDKATKAPVPYASIFLMNGKVRTNADENGYFKLAVVNNEANDSLIITCIGYIPFKCAISSSNILSSGITKIELTHLVYDLKELVILNNNFKNSITLNDFSQFSGPYYGSGNFTAQLAQHFVSPAKNAMIKGIKIARFSIPLLSPQKAIFRIRFYDVDPVSKQPANDLTDQVIEVKSRGKIAELNIEKYKIHIPNKDFFVAIEWLRIPYNATQTNLNGKKQTYYAPSIGWSNNQATNMDIWQLGLNNVWEKFPANLISNNLAIAVSLKY
jgi:hypothetical protein